MKLKEIVTGITCNRCNSELQPMTAEDHVKGDFTHICITSETKKYFDELKKQLDTCKEQNSELMIILPIEYIGDIPVHAFCQKRITRSDVVIYRLQVNLKTFYRYYGGDSDEIKLYESDHYGIPREILTFEKLKNDISMLMEKEQVWLDVLCGEFRLDKLMIDPINARLEIRALFIKTFKGKEGYKLKDKMCCVCYSPTNSITKCGHSLCISCLVGVDKKAKDEYEEDDEYDPDLEVPCPMCRACIRFEWKQ